MPKTEPIVPSRYSWAARVRVAQAIALVFGVFLAFAGSAGAKITYEKVVTEGRGRTVASATTDALIQAIQKVNGESVRAKTALRRLEGVQSREGQEEGIADERLYTAVIGRTRGGVKTYEVLSKSRDPEGTWLVKVSATVARYEARAESKRMRIAVIPLWVSSRPFEALGEPIDKARFERLLNQALVSYLVQTRKFTVLDRNYISDALGEDAIIENQKTPPEEMAKLGQQLSAEFILVGTIEDVQVKEEERKLRSANRVLKSLVGSVEFSYRLINVPTRQIFLSDLYTARYGKDELMDEGEVDTRLVKLASRDLGAQILYSIFPGRIEKISGQEVTIGQGGNAIREGDEFDIYELGEKIVDSYTKESLGRDETKVGTLEITRVTSRMSKGKILESENDLSISFEPGKFIIRPPKEKKQDVSKKIEDLKKEIRQKREERDKKYEDDW